MDLAEFMMARIAEDEAAVRLFEGEYGPADNPRYMDLEVDDHHAVMLVSPERVLAECDAKRRIVEFYGGPVGLHYSLQFLALPYADHEDYQPEWAVDQATV